MTPPRRPRRRLATLAILTSLALAACAKRKAGDSSEPPPPTTAAGADTTKVTAKGGQGGEDRPNAGAPTPTDQRKVIRTGRLELVIASYDETRDKLAAIVREAGGYIDSTQVRHHRGAVSSAVVVLRIPSEGFASTLARLRALGEVVTEQTDAADVTAEYVDVAARLASAKVLEKRLLELAAERTGTIDSVLAVERELARVRGEIEGFEGKLRQWKDRIALSTVKLVLSTRTPAIAAPEQGLGEQISDGFTSSLEALRELGSGLAVAIVALLPWLVLGIPSLLIGRRLWRRHVTRQLPLAIAHPQPQPPPAPPPAEPPADRS